MASWVLLLGTIPAVLILLTWTDRGAALARCSVDSSSACGGLEGVTLCAHGWIAWCQHVTTSALHPLVRVLSVGSKASDSVTRFSLII